MRNIITSLIVALALFGIDGLAGAQTQIFFEDFETGGGDWVTDNGVWEVGTPTNVGPPEAYSPVQCAGTILDGNYDGYQDSRLIYPKDSLFGLWLPQVNGDEELRLNFRYWCSYSSYDYGYVQVSSYDDQASTWSAYETVPQSHKLNGVYSGWRLRDVDITRYAGSYVKLAFYHKADRDSWGNASESSGWYIDDVEVVKKVPVFSGDFESGWADWSCDDNIWEVGQPTSPGPDSAYKGNGCVGTILDGKYEGYRDSRLITPTMRLPVVTGTETLWLSFFQWWSYSSYDGGRVQISTLDESTGDWSDWDDLPGTSISGVSTVWTLKEAELTAYAGLKVRIAFYHTADRDSWGNASESSGWYIDEVAVTGIGGDPELPVLDLKVNGSDGPLYLPLGDNLSVTIELDPGAHAGDSVELWVGALTFYGAFFHVDATGSWTTTKTPYRQEPLTAIPETVVLNQPLPVGIYTFFFVLDGVPNGVFDYSLGDHAMVICSQ